MHVGQCINIHNILNKIPDWKVNLTKYLGYYEIPTSIADFYYLPKYIVSIFSKIIKEMYKSKIFLECAVASTMAIILEKEYQVSYYFF